MKNTILSMTALALMMASCQSNTTGESVNDSLTTDTITVDTNLSGKIKPMGPAPEWAPTIKPEMQAVMEKLASYADQPIPQLSAQQARKNHTPTDAVMDLMTENNIAMPPTTVDTAGKDVMLNGKNIHMRIYTPKTGTGPFPVIVYYHGGGFVIAGIDVYDASAKSLAQETGAIVVAVAYRKAPENKFPAAHDDAYAAYEWVTKNAGSIKGNANKIALAGESAGGNLAVNTAIKTRDAKGKMPKAILAVYPVASSDMNSESYDKYAAAKPLDKPMMEWFVKHYLNNPAEAKDPRINLVAANLKGLPETTIITAEIDPLQKDGEKLADQLKKAGVKVDSRNYEGVTHEFFGMGTIVPEAKQAMKYAAMQLRAAFNR
jgi:acetyl esterase